MNIKSYDKTLFSVISIIFILIVTVLCILPLILVVSGSLSSQNSIVKYGYSFLPREFSLDAYKVAFYHPEAILRAYGVTIFVTIIGSGVGLFITAMTGYVLTRKDFEWRNKFSFFFYFTTLFSGGIVPWYILCVKYLKFNDNILGLLVPFLLNVFYIIVMKSFMSSIPEAITESAKIDGAGDFLIFRELILPLAKPALATIGLFIALNYWNDWFLAFMFIQDPRKFSLQYYLYKIISGAQALSNLSNSPASDKVATPTEPLKLAMTVIATGPIVFVYPVVQRYFVKGLTIGSVKG